jgi:membrane protease YdiL (CAAX protease family)
MKKDKAFTLLALALAALALLAWRIWAPPFSDPLTARLWDTVAVRAVGAVMALSLLLFLRFRVWRFHARTPRGVQAAVLLCALAVCVNNAPWLALLWGEARVLRTELLPLYALSSLAVGAFEELFFRGVALPLWLERRARTRGELFFAVLGTSAVFALLHLLNLAQGASVGATLLQVGYSFLVGAMCAVVLLLCGSVLPCILLHAVYDFGGLLVPTLGSGRIWNAPTVVLTAVLSVAVTLYFLWCLYRTSPTLCTFFYTKEEK